VGVNNGANGDRSRRLILVPLAVALTIGWAAALTRAVVDGDVQPLLIVSVPFGALCGYVFGVTLIRSPR
jgi:hypothetical protein